jgi:tetratricopeptide (TPR) repeat protein
MIATRWFSSLLSLTIIVAAPIVAAPALRAQDQSEQDAVDRTLRHASAEWLLIAPHLPDPATATPMALAQAADVLRARRMPEDALDFYKAALRAGGDEAKLQNDLGVTLLEMQRYPEAKVAFKRALQLKPKAARDWNNLGAVEYVTGRYRAALDDYLRAVKLDKKTAVFHANLGTAYFELKDFESARDQFTKAVKLDRDVFHGGGWAGVEAHVLSANDRGRFCFEMAKMAAQQHEDDDVIRWLARSVESGFDVKDAMGGDKDFEAYRKDARVETIIRNAKAVKNGQVADSQMEPPLPAKAP